MPGLLFRFRLLLWPLCREFFDGWFLRIGEEFKLGLGALDRLVSFVTRGSRGDDGRSYCTQALLARQRFGSAKDTSDGFSYGEGKGQEGHPPLLLHMIAIIADRTHDAVS